jgi:O-methyltransferase
LVLNSEFSRQAHVDAVRPFFAQVAPIRYGTKLRFPGLVWQVLRNKRRDLAILKGEIGGLIAKHGKAMPPDLLDTYLESMVLLHYLQRSGVKVYSMMKPELMESLAEECVRVLQSGVEGDFVDVGVWKGGSAMIMKTLNDRLGGGRKVQLLDIFDTMDFKVLDDSDPIEDRIIITALERARTYFNTEGVCTSVAEIQANFRELGVSLDHVEFLEGNLISEDFPFDRVGPIALLRVDCDFYSATKNTLAKLFPRVQRGGTIIFDDYYLEGFGERLAADELRESLGITSPLVRVGQSAVWHVQ